MHEHVQRRVRGREFLAGAETEERRVRQQPPQLLLLRPLADDHDPHTRQPVQRREAVHVLLRGEPAYVADEQLAVRCEQRLQPQVRPVRCEQLGVHAPPPAVHARHTVLGQHAAHRLDLEPFTVVLDELDYQGSRGSSSRAKNELAANRISLARFSSRFSASSCLIFCASAVVELGSRPVSTRRR